MRVRTYSLVSCLSFCAAALALSPYSSARACSSGCASSDLVADGSTVPANAPAFAITLDLSGVTSSDAAAAFLLVDASGALVPASVTADGGGLLLTPTSPLVENAAYSLHHLESCVSGPMSKPPVTVVTHLMTGAAAPTPEAAGSVIATVAKGDAKVYTNAGSCVVGVDAQIATLTVTPSSDLAPWKPLVRYVTTVDGAPWASTSWNGSLQSDFDTAVQTTRRYDRVFTLCGALPMGAGSDGVSPGSHSVTVSVEIAGLQAALPVATTQITLTCPGGGGGTPSTQDGSSGGCSATSGRPSGGLFGVSVLGIGVSLLRRRKRALKGRYGAPAA